MNEKIGVIIDFLTPAYEKTLRDTAARCGYDIVFFPSSKAAEGNSTVTSASFSGVRSPSSGWKSTSGPTAIRPSALSRAHAISSGTRAAGRAWTASAATTCIRIPTAC